MAKEYISKLEDITTEYYLERVGHAGKPMFIELHNEMEIGREMCIAPHVSRKHASFQRSAEGCWFVKDLASLNGIYKNKKKLTQNCLHRLNPGDCIGLGVPECENNYEFLFTVCHNENFAPCIKISQQTINHCPEDIPVPNGIGQALGDLQTSTEHTVLAIGSKKDASHNVFDLFSRKRDNDPNKTAIRGSKELAKRVDSSICNRDVTVNLGESNNVISKSVTCTENPVTVTLKQSSSEDDDIEIISETIISPKVKCKLNVKPSLENTNPTKKTNITSHYFKNKNEKLPILASSLEPQASCSKVNVDRMGGVLTNEVNSIKNNSRPGPLSKKNLNNVVKELTKPVTQSELGDKPCSISLEIRSKKVENTEIEERNIKSQILNVSKDKQAKHKYSPEDLCLKKLEEEALSNKCCVLLKPLPISSTAKPVQNKSSLSRIEKSGKCNKNKLKKKKRKGRVQVLETSSESEVEILLLPEVQKPIEVVELDFEKMIGTINDVEIENMSYSQMDDVMLLDEDDLKTIWHKPIKIEPTADELVLEDDNYLNMQAENDNDVTNVLQEDHDEVNKLSENVDLNDDPENFFPELSQAFYDEENGNASTSENAVQPKKNAPIQLIEAQALKSRPRYLCGRGEWLKKSSHSEVNTKIFYPKKRGLCSPPIPRIATKNNKSKKKIDLKSKVQAKMGHRIPCPGGGSAIRPEARNIKPQSAKVVKKHTEENYKTSGVKRKTCMNTTENPTVESADSVKKTKKAKITANSRLDKMIKDAEEKSKVTKPLSGFKIPKKPPAPKSLPEASTSTPLVPNSSYPKMNTEVPNVMKITNGYTRPPPIKLPSNVNQRINIPQDTVSTVQRPEAEPRVLKRKIRFADLKDELEHEIPVSSDIGSRHVAEKPKKVNNLPKSNLKLSMQMPSCSLQRPITVTPTVLITPHHMYNADKYLALIFKWNVKWLTEQEGNAEPPPVINGNKLFHSVATHYKSIDDYFQTYFPLIVVETWEMIFHDYKEQKHIPKNFQLPMFITTSFDDGNGHTLGDMVLESVIEYKDLSHFCHYKKGMLITFEMRVIQASNPKAIKFAPTFGYINELKYVPFNVMANQNAQLSAMPASRKPMAQHITLFIKIRPRSGACPNWDRLLRIQPLTYLRPTIRQVESLTNLHNSPLAKYILTPHSTAMTVSVFHQDRFMPIGAYNTAQMKAIQGAGYAGLLPESTPKVVLLQGPPGTGKTHTCVGLIQQLLYGHSEQNTERRLLILTPSNAAIDEITRRLIKLKPSIDVKHPNAPITFVRVGQPESMHSDIRAFSVDEIAIRNLKKTDRRTENDLNLQTNNLQARINSLDTVIISKLSKNQSVYHEQAQIALLHAEMKKIDGRKVQLNACNSKFTKNDPHYKSLIVSFKKKTLTNANVILTTLTSCRQSIIENVFGQSAKPPLKFTACIVDEASQCCEPDLLLPLQYQITKLILIGDPRQLPATVLSQKAASFNYQKSLFERFYDYYQTRESPIVMLNEQYRMHSDICSFPSKYFYNDALYTSPNIDRQLINFPLKPYVLLDLEDSQESNQINSSFENNKEARVIQKLCEEITKIVPNHCSIGIITPYQGQRKLFMRSFPSSSLRRFEFNTVDGFQGREKDITILSCVRANDEQAIGFLKCPQRLNVAITRGCKSLIICGHLESLKRHNHWKSLIEDAKSRQLIFKINSTDDTSKILSFLTKNKMVC